MYIIRTYIQYTPFTADSVYYMYVHTQSADLENFERHSYIILMLAMYIYIIYIQ